MNVVSCVQVFNGIVNVVIIKFPFFQILRSRLQAVQLLLETTDDFENWMISGKL